MIPKVGFAKCNNSLDLFHPTLRLRAGRKQQSPIDCPSLYCSCKLHYSTKFKFNLSEYLLHYAEACNEFKGLISASLQPGKHSAFQKNGASEASYSTKFQNTTLNKKRYYYCTVITKSLELSCFLQKLPEILTIFGFILAI